MRNIRATPESQTIYLQGSQVDEDVVILMNRVIEGVRGLTPPLVVFPADEAAVDVDVREGDGTQLLEVEIQPLAVDRIQVHVLGLLGEACFAPGIAGGWIGT